MDIPVAEDDRARVMLWLTGQSTGAVRPPSDKLLRDMSAAVESLLDFYFQAAAAADAFTAPFRAGWAFRYRNGLRTMILPLEILYPNEESPVIPIMNHTFYDGGVRTSVEITNKPCNLYITPSADPSTKAWGDIVAIDIIAAPQGRIISDTIQVYNISSVSIDGALRKAFRYNAFSASSIRANASIQNDLRIIASIPVTELIHSEAIKVDITPGALANWKLLPKFTDSAGASDGSDNPDSGYNPDAWEPVIDLETEPLDFGLPDKRKWIVDMHLCGIYDRTSISVTLYGSRHRDKWIKVAEGKHGWISAIAFAGFRWWKVRISGTMRRNDRLDALVFNYF